MENIKAQDLRIGNYYESMGREFRLDMKMMYAFCSGSLTYNVNDIKGIPITKERLLKFGFEQRELFFEKMLGANKSITIHLNGNEVLTQVCQGIYGITVPCEYVHQIQNLYYTLTGEELTCN